MGELDRDWMVKTMTENAKKGSPQTTLTDLVAELRAAWEAYDRDGSRAIDEAIEALEAFDKKHGRPQMVVTHE